MKATRSLHISNPDWEKYYQGTDLGAQMHLNSLRFEFDKQAGESYHFLLDWCKEFCAHPYFIHHNEPVRIFFSSDEDRAACWLKFGGSDAG